MTSNDKKPVMNNVAFKDLHMSGWFNNDTGELFSGVHVRPGTKVVDVGCGDGGYVRFCSNMGADVTFIDSDEEKVKGLEQLLSTAGKGDFRGIVSDCNPIPLADGYADLVINTEVLEHVQDPRAFLQEVIRIGSDDATYLLTVPDARGENLLRDVANPIYFREPYHINIFTAEDFASLVTSCGLEILQHDFQAAYWSIFFLLKWATVEPGEHILANVQPATQLWTQTWNEILEHPQGKKIRDALNQALPRCQVIVARRKGATGN